MSKLAELEFTGNFQQGFSVNLIIYENDQLNAKREVGKSGYLPISNLDELYEIWANAYQTWLNVALNEPNFGLQKRAAIANVSTDNSFYTKAENDLLNAFHNWLKSPQFAIIQQTLNQHLNSNEANRILIKSDDLKLKRLPWQKWDLLQTYILTEIGLSSPNFRSVKSYYNNKNKVRILVILGKDANIQDEITHLENLGDYLEVKCIYPQDVLDLDQPLWEESWDILLFNGHSKSYDNATTATITLDKNLTIDISVLRNHLQKAIENGLRLAIFNSCEGLGIAYQLAEGGELYLPQVLVMRELLPMAIAPVFLRYFLEVFTKGNSLYKSVREARNRLQLLENKYFASSWLPIICQNPSESPLNWQELAPLPPCPYRGLLAFLPEHKDLFKGRKQATKDLITLLKQKHFVAVIGASGAGKSSLVFAGLIPLLPKIWLVLNFRPGQHPFESLSAIICQGDQAIAPTDIQELARNIRNNYQVFVDEIEDKLSKNEMGNLFLVIDQFEELYTLCADKEEQKQFIDCLLYAVSNASNFKLVMTIRADFMGYALSYNPLVNALQNADLKLGPMTEQELKEAIILPAQNCGVQLEKGLLERILDAVGTEPDNLPLLEFTLTQLWHKQSSDRQRLLTNQAYDELQGLKQALNDHAESIYSELTTEEKHQIQRIFLQLLTPGEGTEDTRRVATRTEIKEENWDLVCYLNQENVRLVVIGYDQIRKEETVEVVHEILIKGWVRLETWINNNRGFRVWQEKLRFAMQQWEQSNNDDSALLRGRVLLDAEKWLEERRGEISEPEIFFIQLSIGLREREKRQELERERRARKAAQRLTIVAMIVVIIVTGLGIFANYQRLEAEKQTELAKLRENATSILNLLSTQPINSLVLAIQITGKSLSKFNNVITPIQYSLVSAINVVKEENILLGHKGSVLSVNFSPDGKMIVSGSADKTIRLWDLQGNLIREPFRGHENEVTSVAFSPDGKMIVSGSADKTIKLWNLQGNLIREPFRGHENKVTSVAFSPDGKMIISGSADETLRLWDLQGNLIKQDIKIHSSGRVNHVSFSSDKQIIIASDTGIYIFNIDGKVRQLENSDASCSVAFSPNSKTVVSAGGCQSGTLPVLGIDLWDVDQSFKSLNHQTFREHKGSVASIAFSPDGKSFVSGGFDNTVRLWEREKGKQELLLIGHQDVVNSVAFSPNGKQVISASDDGTIRLWNLRYKREIKELNYRDSYQYSNYEYHQYTDIISSLIFSPDSKLVAIARENTVQLWDIKNNILNQPFIKNQAAVNSIAFSPDGQMIVSASNDKIIKLWNIKGNLIEEPFKGHQDSVESVAFSSNGQMILSGSRDKTIRLWDLKGNFLRQFVGHNDIVNVVTFSPDGQMILSGSRDKTIRLWDLKGNFLRQFVGHNDIVNAVTFSPDGQMIASASNDKTIKLWDLKGNFLRQFVGHNTPVISLSFSPDGQIIVSSDLTGNLRFWDINGNEIYPPIETDSLFFLWMSKVAFSPDGMIIAFTTSSKYDGTLQLLPGNWQSWLKIGCDRLQYHPVFTNPQTEVQKKAKQTCEKYVWSKE